jgi:hypothetical protein
MFALAMGLSLVAGIRSRAEACGQCIEDKVAATYDYEVLTRAASRGHVVVFTEIRGPAAGAGPALRAFVKKALSTAPGVDPGTVRVSLDPPAASFACDPASHAPRTLIETINARISSRRLSVAAIEIDRGSHTIWKAAR